MTNGKFFGLAALVVGVVFFIAVCSAEAAPIAFPQITIGAGTADTPSETATSMQILFLLTVLSLAPAILIMVTSFTRIIIVLSFVRSGLATQQMPPNQVLIGLALFMTFFIMMPVYQEVDANAIQPYMAGDITQEVAFEKGINPLRDFMYRQTREKDIALFASFANIESPKTIDDIPTHVLIPSFIISELKTAFEMGFLIFIPFIIVDMVVASVLMSMGMMMLPPVMISLPFKILLFIMVDGWHLVVRSLLVSFGM